MKTKLLAVLVLSASCAYGSCESLHLAGYGSEPFYASATRACHDKSECVAPRPGEIMIVNKPYGEVEGCNFWKASPSQAGEIVRSFDVFESHAPEVVYKSTGKYPVYYQRVVSGGCPPNTHNLNCQD